MILSKEKIKPKEYTCTICGNKVLSKAHNKMYCSDDCKKIGTKEHRKKPEVREGIKRHKRKHRQNPEVIKRYNEDPYLRKVDNLRRRLSVAMRVYTKTGKIRTSREYGIDYKKIIEHLMENRPEGVIDSDLFNSRKWHIDHIMPLSKFDLNDPVHVKKKHSLLKITSG